MKAVSNMEELLVQATSGQGGRPAGKHRTRFGTVNVGAISGRANEIACRRQDEEEDWLV